MCLYPSALKNLLPWHFLCCSHRTFQHTETHSGSWKLKSWLCIWLNDPLEAKPICGMTIFLEPPSCWPSISIADGELIPLSHLWILSLIHKGQKKLASQLLYIKGLAAHCRSPAGWGSWPICQNIAGYCQKYWAAKISLSVLAKAVPLSPITFCVFLTTLKLLLSWISLDSSSESG